MERPSQRSGFRHPRLIAWVRANRARLVAACLTLCQAWIAAGRPKGGRVVGSFESWSEVMGGVLEVAGIEGFLENIDETSEESDVETAAWAAFIGAWWRDFGGRPVGTVNLYVLALNCDPGISLKGFDDRAQRTSLGMAIGKMRDRVFRAGDLRLRVQKSRQHAERQPVAAGGGGRRLQQRRVGHLEPSEGPLTCRRGPPI